MIPAMKFQQTLQDFLNDAGRNMARFPWRDTALTLRDRFREDHMGLTASSLTFTTITALVPFFTVALAIFTAFPTFSKLEDALQSWLVQSLIPENIARQVLGYLTQFSRQASKLGAAGFGALLVTAIVLILTIDRTLNDIWRVKKPRPLTQRVLIYWAAITLGPVLLASSLALTSYVVSSAGGWVVAMPFSLQFVLSTFQFVLMASGLAALYHYVPNTFVKWGHAWTGGLFAAVGIEIAKKLLGIYLAQVPTYSMIYGAFATFPILLLWIYMAWIIVLMGAVIAAYLPSLLAGVKRRGGGPGWHFQLALEVLQALQRLRLVGSRSGNAEALAQALRVNALQLAPVFEALTKLQWIGQLVEPSDQDARYVLLVVPEQTLLAPLMQLLLLEQVDVTNVLWRKAQLSALTLNDVI